MRLRPAGWAVLRTPLLPHDAAHESALADPVVEEALQLASPGLADAPAGPKADRGRARYVARMRGRATPFGLFAGTSFVRVGDATTVRLAPRDAYRRHSRLDCELLSEIVESAAADRALRAGLAFRPNDSAYEVGGRLRYAEGHVVDGARSYRLSAVDASPPVLATIERARDGALPATLAARLVADDPEVSAEEAAEFVDELIDAQVLIPVAAPRVTGADPETGLADNGIDVEAVRARVKPRPGRTVQVDLMKPAEGTLGPRVVAAARRAAELLHRIGGATGDPLGGFRRAFIERYEHAEIPLVHALDEELGVGLDAMAASTPSAEAAPLLEGIQFPLMGASAASFGARDAHLLRRLEGVWARGETTLELDDADLAALEVPGRLPLSPTVAVLGTVLARDAAAVDAGDFRFLVQAVTAPGAALLGRFCHGDPELHAAVRAYLAEEQALYPDAVLAEIVHLPEGRIGNVIARPVLRDTEIQYLGDGSAPTRLPVQDLFVRVEPDGRIILWSRRLGREVMPRLTTAHNYDASHLGLYRFLARLQGQGLSMSAAFHWGAVAAARRLPRVTYRDLVLAPARWRLRPGDPRPEDLPARVALGDGDQLLPLDLGDAHDVDLLTHELGRKREVILTELPAADEHWLRGPEGAFVHELLVPFIHETKPPARATPAPRASVPRRRPPGSEWLYLQVYTGTATSDEVLGALPGPPADIPWFFVRYGDPHWHLRLRYREPGLQAPLLAALQPLVEDGRVWRIAIGTYDRELERYGGDAGMDAAERMFWYDSEAALALLTSLPRDQLAEARWRLALRGMHRLLVDLGLDLDARLALVASSRKSFFAEHGGGPALEHQLATRYRKLRSEIEELVSREQPLDEAFDVRAARIAAEDTALLRPSADHFLHMHANRMLRWAHRAQELILYDFLERTYRSQLARSRRAGPVHALE